MNWTQPRDNEWLASVKGLQVTVVRLGMSEYEVRADGRLLREVNGTLRDAQKIAEILTEP